MQELPFLHSARRLMLIDICMKFRQESLRGFQVTERPRFVTDRQTDRRTDRQTDRRTDGCPGKTICLPTLKGGHNDLFHYFKNLNETDTDEDENSNVDIREGFQLNETAEQEINLPITEKEILDSTNSLKNNKAPGPDSIVNEHIKSTVQIMLPTYVKLFTSWFSKRLLDRR